MDERCLLARARYGILKTTLSARTWLRIAAPETREKSKEEW